MQVTHASGYGEDEHGKLEAADVGPYAKGIYGVLKILEPCVGGVQGGLIRSTAEDLEGRQDCLYIVGHD